MVQSNMRMLRIRIMVTASLALLALASAAPAAAQTGDPSQAMAMGAGRGLQGTVTVVAADHLTMKTETGELYQVVVTPNTRLLKGRDPMKLADVHPGDGLGAMGEIDPATKTVHALFVMVISAEQVKAAREAMGKTFISGTVTAIHETRLTILRTDQVSQTIEVDEDTSFRKGGRGLTAGYTGGRDAGQSAAQSNSAESVTLADVKVGYMVAGPGQLKNGVFVPTQLGIADPTTQRQRRRPQQDAKTGSPTPPPERR